MFAQDGKNQFVCEELNPGFINEVRKYLIELGIPEDRIVYNYGVTKGSIKIPLVILSKDYSHALCGLWCEKPTNAQFNYLDYNNNYFNILCHNNGWNLQKVNILDWYLGEENVKKTISSFVNMFVKEG